MHIPQLTDNQHIIQDMRLAMNVDGGRACEEIRHENQHESRDKPDGQLGPLAQQLLGLDGVTEELLTRLVTTSVGSLPELCSSLNLTLDELSEWIAKPVNRRRVFNLLALADAQTQMLLSQHRVMAAAQMARLATDEKSPRETARRACKDLLQMRVAEHRGSRTAGGGNDLSPLKLEMPREAFPAPPIEGMSKQEILMLMKRM